MNTNSAIIYENNPQKIIQYLEEILCKKYGKQKAVMISVQLVKIIETKLIRPRSNYLIQVKGNIETGEVYLYSSSEQAYVDVEAKVSIKHLKYTRRLPWLDFKIRVR